MDAKIPPQGVTIASEFTDNSTANWMQQQIIATLALATCKPGASKEEVMQQYALMTRYVRDQSIDLMNPPARSGG